jgi:hypothetical protein
MSLDWASINGKRRGYSTTNPETQSAVHLDGGFYFQKVQGLLF